MSKTTTLHMQHTLLYISLPSLHDCDVKLPQAKFYRGRKHKTLKESSSREIHLYTFSYIANPCYGQSTAVKTEYPLTSVTCCVAGSGVLRDHVVFFKFTADQLLVFNWSQAQVPWFSKWKSSTSRFFWSGKLFYSRSISLQWLQVPIFFLDVSCNFIKGSFAFSPGEIYILYFNMKYWSMQT